MSNDRYADVVQLLARTVRAVDVQDVDAYGECWTDDGTAEVIVGSDTPVTTRGRSALQKRAATFFARPGAKVEARRLHFVSNAIVERDERTPTYVADSYLLLCTVTDSRVQVQTTGLYTDRIVDVDNALRIEHRLDVLDRQFG